MYFDFLPIAGEKALACAKHVVVVVDGVDELRSDHSSQRLDWVPILCPPGIRMVISCVNTSDCVEHMCTLCGAAMVCWN